MRFFISTLLIALLAGCAAAPAQPDQPALPEMAPTATLSPDWQLVWADEFDQPDGAPPDPARWTAVTGGGGWGNEEWQHYTDRVENAAHQDGSLVITARREDYQGNRYTSARVISRGKADFTYGRFEARARLPVGQAIWPAIWMLPSGSVYGGWPDSGEIDIVELVGHEPDTVHGTIHFGSPHEQRGASFSLPEAASFGDDYHIFAVEWEPGEIRWYVDGYHYYTAEEWFTASPSGAFPAPFDQPFHIIMNVAVGGVWPGPPDATTPEEASLSVDYIRVYQK